MRLIDANKLAEWYSQTHGVRASCVSDCLVIKEIVECAPTVDAEPVIRCADCANYHMPEDGEEYGRCWKHDIIMKPDDFCSRAENVWGG